MIGTLNMKTKLFSIFILSTLLIAGCGAKKTPEPTISAEQIQQWAAQTVNAIVAQEKPVTTQIAVIPQTTPTSQIISIPPTLPPQPPTAVPTIPQTNPGAGAPAAPIQRACDQFGFVSDVTVPDKTAMQPNQGFQKIWRIQNTGSCTWTPAYQFVFYSGDQLSAPGAVQIPGTVAPGQTVDIAVDMRAPNVNGEFQGNWLMRNSSGAIFGTSAATTPIWVKIKVSEAAANVPANTPVPGASGSTCTILSISPNGSESFAPNSKVTFAVSVRNDSAVTWDTANYDLAFIDGNNMLENKNITAQDIPYNIPPGQTLNVSFGGITPNTNGLFPMTWGVVQNNVINCQFTFRVNIP